MATLIDVIVGNYIPSKFGWIFLIVVVLIESILLSIILNKTLFNKKTTTIVMCSNLTTTLIGFFIFNSEYNGGYLLSWIPVNEYQGELRPKETIELLLFSFVLTIAIELTINYLVLKKKHSPFRVIIGTVIINIVTYCIAAIVFIYFANELLKSEPLPYIYFQF